MTANPASNHIWNAYAGDFTGFCIGFQPEIFEGYANGPIHYVPELPVFRGDEDTMAYFVNLIYLKHEQYRAEAEYRISRFWPPNEPTINQRKLQATPQQVAEVIIGYKAPAEFADFVYKQLPNTLIRIANPDGTGGVILS